MAMMSNATPLQLAKRSLLGSILSLAFLPVVLGCVRLKPLWLRAGLTAWIIAGVLAATPLIVAFLSVYTSEKLLRAGLLNDRWPDSRVAEARIWLDRRVVRRGITCIVVIGVASIFAVTLFNHRSFGSLGGFMYLMIMPLVTLSRLKQHVAAPSQPASRLWSDSKPLYSAHWRH